MPSLKNVGGNELKVEERDASIGHHVRVWFNDNSDENHPTPFVLVETWDNTADKGQGAWVPDRYEVQPTKDETESDDNTSVLTSYRVSWMQKGTDRSRATTCIVNSDDMTRPGDPEQLNALLRKMLAIRYLPIGQVVPDNIVLEMVDPICNCEPYPGENCTYAEHRGERFYLTTSIAFTGCEVIHDRHRDTILGIVHNTLSVEFLTMVRKKYQHQ